jgi:hypothetical protein
MLVTLPHCFSCLPCSQHKYLQRLAANAIMNMAYDCADSRAAIAEAGAIPPLVAMLKLPSRSCQVSSLTDHQSFDLLQLASCKQQTVVPEHSTHAIWRRSC